MSEHSTDEAVNRAILLIRTSLDENASFGDAHYYRALVVGISKFQANTGADPLPFAADDAGAAIKARLSTHGSSRSDDLRQVSYLYTYDTDVTSRDQVFGNGC